ncbi:sterile alpha motif domain-containing protein 13 isoform X5 [Paroedura picta]
MLSIDMENKENGSFDTENLVENGRPPDPADWAVTDVVNYFRTVGFEEQANAFQEQGVSPIAGTGFTSFGPEITESCTCSSVTSLNDSGKGKFKSIITIKKTMNGKEIITKRILVDGKEIEEKLISH